MSASYPTRSLKMSILQLLLMLTIVHLLALSVSALSVPVPTDRKANNVSPTKGNRSPAPKEKPKYGIINQAENSTPRKAQPSTTQEPHSDKLIEIDYYDYAQDQPVDKTVKQEKKPDIHKPFPGCPDLTIFCQQHCEDIKYYSGYCEKKACICYGKL